MPIDNTITDFILRHDLLSEFIGVFPMPLSLTRRELLILAHDFFVPDALHEHDCPLCYPPIATRTRY